MKQLVNRLSASKENKLRANKVGILIVMALALLPLSALALPVCSTPSLPSTYQFPPIKISASDLQPGDEIPGASSVAHYNITCTETVAAGNIWQLREWPAGTTTTTNISNVYSDVALPPGIGYTVKNSAGSRIPLTTEFGVRGFTLESAAGFKSGVVSYTLSLVKIGTLPSTETAFSFPLILSVPGISWANPPLPGNDPTNSIRNFVGVASSIVKTCTASPDSENINLTLPTISSSSLVNVGDKAGRQAFSINIDCEPNSSISVGFTDATNMMNESDVLTLSPASTASGIGVQLTTNGESIIFSPQSTRQGTEIQESTTTTAERLSLPLAVEYIKTASTITAGSVDAKALFTIHYN